MKRLAAWFLAAILGGGPAAACGVELVLAIDVSRSVVNAEYRLQRDGLASAFRHPAIVEAIGSIDGGIAVTVTEWSGADSQTQTIGWRLIRTPAEVRGFAKDIAASERKSFAAYTAIGEALLHADALSAINPWKCKRRVIDISGDGVSNRGRHPREISNMLASLGVTINAVVIDGARPDPVDFYQNEVIAGPGAFVEIARDFSDYARAIKAKLQRELVPAIVWADPPKCVQTPTGDNCRPAPVRR